MLGITWQRAKLTNVMQRVPSDMMDEISNVLLDLSEHKPYSHSKEVILILTGCSEGGHDPRNSAKHYQRWQDANPVPQIDEEPARTARVREGSYGRNACPNYHPDEESHISGWFGRVCRRSFHPIWPRCKCRSNHWHYKVQTVRTERNRRGVGQPAETITGNIDLCANEQGDRHLPDNYRNKTPAEKGHTTRAFVGFIACLAMKPGTADLPCKHTPAQGNK